MEEIISLSNQLLIHLMYKNLNRNNEEGELLYPNNAQILKDLIMNYLKKKSLKDEPPGELFDIKLDSLGQYDNRIELCNNYIKNYLTIRTLHKIEQIFKNDEEEISKNPEIKKIIYKIMCIIKKERNEILP